MPHPTRLPALPRRFFPVREHFETSARALDIVEEISLDATSPDAAFVAACKELIEVDGRRSRLLDLSRRSAADERQLAMLDERFASLLRTVIGLRPSTPQGHRARAAAFLAADSHALVTLVNRSEQHEARMLAALVFDLSEKP